MDERSALDAMLGIMREYDLDELTVRAGESTYQLVARAETSAGNVSSRVQTQLPAPEAPSPPAAAPNVKKVSAPIVGVFYRSSAPGTEPFVEAGDRVEVGQVLCILEAMKLMNEITSDYAGTVSRILPENGALVSLGEEMFWIEP